VINATAIVEVDRTKQESSQSPVMTFRRSPLPAGSSRQPASSSACVRGGPLAYRAHGLLPRVGGELVACRGDRFWDRDAVPVPAAAPIRPNDRWVIARVETAAAQPQLRTSDQKGSGRRGRPPKTPSPRAGTVRCRDERTAERWWSQLPAHGGPGEPRLPGRAGVEGEAACACAARRSGGRRSSHYW
jgi:hypothetical protein